MSLGDVLAFVTGADEEPMLGFTIPPELHFYEVHESFLPTANTCIGCLRLPRPSLEKPLPDTADLFEIYDLAFMNTYFGSI